MVKKTWITCPDCNGSGTFTIRTENTPPLKCSTCRGRGSIKVEILEH